MSKRRRGGTAPVLAACLLLAGACSDDPAGPEGSALPVIAMSSVGPVEGNVLAALVEAGLSGADSGRVRFGVAGGPLDSVTPAVTPAAPGSPLALPVLGLLPEADYRMLVEATGPGGTSTSDTLTFQTGALPDDLPAFTTDAPAPEPGFVAFSRDGYGLVIDNAGRVVWYLRLPGGPSLNFQPQPTGEYVLRPGGAEPTAPLLAVDVLGRVVRELRCADGLIPRFHDALVELDGSYWLLCDRTEEMDLSAIGGVSGALVTGTEVQHRTPDGELRFRWSVFDHFALTDLEASQRAGVLVNWTHGNALAFDADGDLYLSFRSLNEVTKVDRTTGDVLWRMGGLANQFAFPDGALPFARQHGLRISSSGVVQVLDNTGQVEGSRSEQYIVDPSSMTARLAGIRYPTPATRANLGGSTQWLGNGHQLVAHGDGGRVEEYDADGALAWRIVGDAGYVFRATRIASLYHPGQGLRR